MLNVVSITTSGFLSLWTHVFVLLCCNSSDTTKGNNPLLCLLADKAYTNTHEFRRKTPDLEIHGCFSVIANLHALGMFKKVKQRGK